MGNAQTIELNGAMLKAEASKHHELATLLFYGANRDRNREVTDIDQMRKGIEGKHGESIDPARWLEAFKRLEEMGMGSLILGRRGSPHRFRWNYSLKAIGTAAVKGLTLTAHPIAPKVKGGKVVNDYSGSRSALLYGDVKRPTKAYELNDAPPREAPIKAMRAAPVAATTTSVYMSLSSGVVFEAEIPALTAKEADHIISLIRRCVK